MEEPKKTQYEKVIDFCKENEINYEINYDFFEYLLGEKIPKVININLKVKYND